MLKNHLTSANIMLLIYNLSHITLKKINFFKPYAEYRKIVFLNLFYLHELLF